MTSGKATTQTRSAIAALWQCCGGDVAALDDLDLSGDEPALPSSFRIGTAAQASIGAAGLAAAELWRQRTGRRQRVRVDMRHAAVEFRSERYLRVAGKGIGSLWESIAGLYRTGDGGHVRLHTNFRHHRDAVLSLLGCEPTREAVQAALLRWNAVDFETRAYDAGCVVAALRSPEAWAAHAQAAAVASLPPLAIEKIGEAPPHALSDGPRPLSGLHVLDLTRVIAGPVGGRTLAAHGATVMRIGAANLPTFEWLDRDTGRGKLSAHADLKSSEGRRALERLVTGADVFIQGYRPGAIAALGFAPADVARLKPGIVQVSLSAYGHLGPWAGRRGFDSLVQTASGFNQAEGAAGGERPRELPCQALDHASGYLIALGAMLARARQARAGGSWLVRVSLAQTGRWIWQLGREAQGFAAADPGYDEVQDLMETSASPFGEIRAVKHAALLSETPARWDRPTVPPGTHAPAWPEG